MRSRLNVPDVDPTYVGEDWKLGITAIVKRDIVNIRNLIEEYEKTSLTFKSSSKKSDASLCYIPVNLHLHVFKMNGIPPVVPTRISSSSAGSNSPDPNPTPVSYTCDFMTVGAFAAHSMKFKSGGLWHMMKMFDERISKQTRGLVPVLKNDFRLPDEVITQYYNCLINIGLESSLSHTITTRSENVLYGI